ncbi:MAG: phosphotransferase family protein [Candidatus Solibacter usitatus]|nr:phosphotransferase family protein [Candidatus Solibacter usitatus]
MDHETAAPRSGEEIAAGALSAWLGEPVEVRQFPGGHSNLTYLVTTPARELVLRRPPVGPVAAKAHDMAREYRFLKALHPQFWLAPRPVALCEDTAVLGCTFLLMERRHGRILRGEQLPEEERAEASRAFVQTLAELHGVDARRPELAVLGRPAGFLERQVQGWGERWQRCRPETAVELDRALARLAESVPAESGATVIHNDYKLDNLMLDRDDAGRATAVLDWEMAALGDPLFDLGVALTYWSHAAMPGLLTAAPGWWTRDEVVEQYARMSGRDVSRLGWHEAFGVFKLAVIVQQIYGRWQRGQTADDRFAGFGEVVRALGARVSRLLEHAH